MKIKSLSKGWLSLLFLVAASVLPIGLGAAEAKSTSAGFYTQEELSNAFLEGLEKGATHMLLVWDTFDPEDMYQFSVYVYPDEDVLKRVAHFTAPGYYRVASVYAMHLPLAEQLKESRPWHVQTATYIGYWRTEEDEDSLYPWPQAHAEPINGLEVFLDRLTYVEEEIAEKRDYFGISHCRLCGEAVGSQEYLLHTATADYIWPEGYTHYLSAHFVCPPAVFIDLIHRVYEESL